MIVRGYSYILKNVGVSDWRDAGEAGVGGSLEGMLPEADNFPALAVEFAVPEGAVGVRTGGALRADVPIASAVKRRNVRDRYI